MNSPSSQMNENDKYEQKKELLKNRKGIWWLSSYPKSGNTWIRYMLALYFGGLHLNLNNMSIIKDDIRHADTQGVCSKPVDQISKEEAMLLRPAALHQKITLHRENYPLILKTHNRSDILTEYLQVPWLTFGAIHIVRDPRDVVISLAAHTGVHIDDAIKQLNSQDYALENKNKPVFMHFISDWSTHVNGWFRQPNFNVMCIRYEDILTRPAHALQTILRYMCVEDIDDSYVEQVVDRANFNRMQGFEEINSFNEAGKSGRFFNHGTSGHYKEILTRPQVKRIEANHQEMMKTFDYL